MKHFYILLLLLSSSIVFAQNGSNKSDKKQKKKTGLFNNSSNKSPLYWMNKEYDDFDDVYMYLPHGRPKVNSVYDQLYPFVICKKGLVYLKLYAKTEGKDWLFFDRFAVKIDGEVWKFENIVEPVRETKTSETYGVRCVEFTEIVCTDREIQFMKDVANAEKVEVRFKGKTYHRDKTLDYSKLYQRTLDAYYYLLENPPKFSEQKSDDDW